jgi:hypothetical protein
MDEGIKLGRRGKIYFTAVLLFIVVLVMSTFETRAGYATVYDLCWQIIVSTIGGLWFWNLLRIEMIRTARRRK